MTDSQMSDEQIREQHIKDGNKALVSVSNDTTISDRIKDYRLECINEFITLWETGSNEHINIYEKHIQPEHFK